MQPTCSLKYVFEREVYKDPFETFVKYNLEEVRDACLEEINKIRDIGGTYHAEWAEQVIEHLRKNRDRHYWKKIFEWYLYAVEGSSWRDEDARDLRQAIEFALALSHDEEGLVSKLLAGRLKRNFSIDIYGKMPSLKSFFHKLALDFYWEKQLWRSGGRARGMLRSGEYGNEAWHKLQRAIDVAVLAEDFSLIENIDIIIFLIEEGVLRPDRYSHWSTKDMHFAYLKAAKERLKEIKRRAAEQGVEEETE